MTERREEGGVVILKPQEAKLDASNAVAARERLAKLAPPGGRMVFDLSGVTFVDSSGVGVLLHVLRHHRETGGRVVFAAPQAQVRQILDIVSFQNIADIADSTSEALALLTA